jgi:PhnB protein
MKLTTYLNYGGNCAEALRFYEQYLGGKIKMMATYAEMPDGNKCSPELQKAIMHARITIGETELMASDVPPERFQQMQGFSLTLSVSSNDEAERIYKLLSEGGAIQMPMQETFFAHRFGVLKDKFGTSWMVIHERPMGPEA